MKHLSIRAKLIAAFAAMALLLVAQGLLSANRLEVVNGLTTEMEENWLPSTRFAGAVKAAVAEFRIAEARHILAATDEEMDKVEDDLRQRLAKLKDVEGKYARLIANDEERRLYETFTRAWTDYMAVHPQVVALSRKSQNAEATALFKGRGREFFQAVGETIDRIVELNVQGGIDASKRGDVIYSSASTTLYVLMGAGALLAAAAAWLMMLSVSNPIRRMTTAMAKLADGDASVEIPALDHKDEVGEMAQAVSVFKENLIRTRRMEQEAKEAEARAAAEKRRSMLDLAQRFEDRVGSIVNSVGSAATELQATASQLAAAVEEVSAQCVAVAAASEQASANVQTVASASEEMSTAIHQLSDRVTRAAGRSKAAAEGATQAQRELDGLSSAIEQVDQIVAAINSVASQTNLLALNATIEAARAGDAGKGFAVVASEVKNLANQTHAMTEQIGSNLAAVKGASGKTVEAMRAIIGQVEDIDHSTAEMAASVEQQSAATGEISRNAQQAAVGTSEVSQNVAGIQQAENETSSATNNVKHAADSLAGQSAMLKQEMDSFLAEIRAA